jgi:DNA-binding CsgD family transcriptional regulator
MTFFVSFTSDHDEASGTPAGSAGRHSLSDKEEAILRWLAQGQPNKLIARSLGITEATVKVHCKSIYRKLRVANRTQAAVWWHHICRSRAGR